MKGLVALARLRRSGTSFEHLCRASLRQMQQKIVLLPMQLRHIRASG